MSFKQLLIFVKVFGHLFPPFFKNWWSDDWISTVYGVEHTFRCEDVTIKHNVNAQKTSGLTRYNVDQVRAAASGWDLYEIYCSL